MGHALRNLQREQIVLKPKNVYDSVNLTVFDPKCSAVVADTCSAIYLGFYKITEIWFKIILKQFKRKASKG